MRDINNNILGVLDIIKTDHVVNEYSHFIVINIAPLELVYMSEPSKKYEDSPEELLGVTRFEIIGNLDIINGAVPSVVKPKEPYIQDINKLVKNIEFAINKHSAENGTDTPDYILKEYLFYCLMAFDLATERRDSFLGNKASMETPSND